MMLKRYLLLLVFGVGSLCNAGRLLGAEIQAGGGQQSDQKSNESKKGTSPNLGNRDSTRVKKSGTSAKKGAAHKGAKKTKGKKSKKSSESTPAPK